MAQWNNRGGYVCDINPIATHKTSLAFFIVVKFVDFWLWAGHPELVDIMKSTNSVCANSVICHTLRCNCIHSTIHTYCIQTVRL